MSRPIRSDSFSGPIGWAQPSSMPLSMSSRLAMPDSNIRIADRRYGISSAFTTKPERSWARMACLPSTFSAKVWARAERALGGGERRDQLDELLHRGRVEEVDADDLVGPRGGDRQLHQRDGGGVGGEDRVRAGHDLVEHLEDLGLHLLVLDDGLDHQVTVGELAEVGGEASRACVAVPLLLGDLAALGGLGQGVEQPGAADLQGLAGGLGDLHVQSGAGAHLGDARSHLAAAHHSDACDISRRDVRHIVPFADLRLWQVRRWSGACSVRARYSAKLSMIDRGGHRASWARRRSATGRIREVRGVRGCHRSRGCHDGRSRWPRCRRSRRRRGQPAPPGRAAAEPARATGRCGACGWRPWPTGTGPRGRG